MESFFTRFRNPLVLLAIVLVQVIALAVQVPHARDGAPVTAEPAKHSTMLRHWAVSIAAPLERAATGTGHGVAEVWTHYMYLRHEREQNDALRQENQRLKLEQAAFAEDAAESRRLRALLHFQQQYIGQTVAAQVIGTSGSDRSRLLTLDKGALDGLRADDAVMTADGIVGKLRYVFPHTAQLLLISDPASGAGVLLRDSRIRGILRGTTDGHVEITSLTADARIRVGETVVTSGGDQVYPRGLPVGTIVSMAPDREHQPYLAITIKPAADLARLDEVLVVTGTQPGMTAQQSADAATAEQTALAADAQKRAADLVAERLPSAADPNAKPGEPAADPTVGGVPNVPNSGVPRPVQPVHSDRYTPGTAPPADELKPGAQSGSQEPAQTPAHTPATAASPQAFLQASQAGRLHG